MTFILASRVAAIEAPKVETTAAIAALAAAERPGLPLRGIVHAAGTIDDALIANLGLDQIRSVFTGKVMGAWHLHELTQSRQLDFFVLYSSVAAALGTPGQAHYAAANRMLDAIAGIRRSRGLPAASIAFGAIGDRGYLTRRQDVARYISGAGIQPLPAGAALAALGTILRHAPTDVAFAEMKAAPTGKSERSFSRHRKSKGPVSSRNTCMARWQRSSRWSRRRSNSTGHCTR